MSRHGSHDLARLVIHKLSSLTSKTAFLTTSSSKDIKVPKLAPLNLRNLCKVTNFDRSSLNCEAVQEPNQAQHLMAPAQVRETTQESDLLGRFRR